MKNNLHSEISKIVNHAVYESGAGNDVLISNDVDNILALIKKHEREFLSAYVMYEYIDFVSRSKAAKGTVMWCDYVSEFIEAKLKDPSGPKEER